MSLASSVHAGPGAYALLVGSGVSSAAGVPTGWDVTLDLVERYATGLDEDPGEDLIGWYQSYAGGEPDYSVLLEDLAPSPEDRRNLLAGYFEPSDEERAEGIKLPTAAHRAIAALVDGGFVRVIVTPNFDRLLETALGEAGVQPAVISSAAHADGALPLVHSDCTIVKVHGDYLSPNLKNTIEELDHYEPAIDALLDRVFDEYGLVVCGWSATWDSALRNALLRAPNRRFATYWMHISEPSDHAREVIANRQAIPMQIADADTAFEALGQTVAALAELADQQTQDTAAAVARLKRFLPDPAHRIRLVDLVTTETELLIDRVASLPNPAEVTVEIYRDHVRAYEEAATRLVTLVATGSRFSDMERHDQLWADTVQRLATRTLPECPHGHLRDMQQYPTLLAMYAIALGSAAADRIEPIAQVLGSVTAPRDGEATRIASAVSAWRVFDWKVFRQAVEGVEQSRVPISKHLFSVLRPVTREFIPDDQRYATLFDEVEYLFGVSYGRRSALGNGPVGLGAFRAGLDGDLPEGFVDRHQDRWIACGIFDDSEHCEKCRAEFTDRCRHAIHHLG